MQIRVALPTSKVVTLEAPSHTTIQTIKGQVEVLEGIKTYQQRIYLGFHELADNETLYNYNLGWSSTLRLEITRDMTTAPALEGSSRQACLSAARFKSREWQTDVEFYLGRIQIAMQKARVSLERNGKLMKQLALPSGWLKDFLTKLSGDFTRMAQPIEIVDDNWAEDSRARLQPLDIRTLQQLVQMYSRLVATKPSPPNDSCSYVTNRCFMDNEAVNAAISIDDLLCALIASFLEIARGCTCHLDEAAEHHNKLVRYVSRGSGWDSVPEPAKEQLKERMIRAEKHRQAGIDISEDLPKRSLQAVGDLASMRADLLREALKHVEGNVARMDLLKALIAALELAGKDEQALRAAEELRITKGGSSRLNIM